jgi:hypothetical protein
MTREAILVIAREGGRSSNHKPFGSLLDAPLFAGHDSGQVEQRVTRTELGYALAMSVCAKSPPLNKRRAPYALAQA